jgi:hypothetical protein
MLRRNAYVVSSASEMSANAVPTMYITPLGILRTSLTNSLLSLATGTV